MRRIVLGVCLLLLATACSVPRAVPEGGVIAGQIVNTQGQVLILSTQDGQEQGQDPAHGSGRELVSALRKALSAHAVPVSISESRDVAQGYDEAAKIGFDYVLRPTITLWEDNATAWSGKGDKLEISIELYDVKSHRLTAASSFYRVATGFTLASGTPDRFMDECSNGALGKIYGWPKDAPKR
ncbi:MAG: DUF4823 domain-containing protein [Acidobacteria bacterium]|nr:DUF4823 domain-containing protein [Acidobacteriota bacterium]